MNSEPLEDRRMLSATPYDAPDAGLLTVPDLPSLALPASDGNHDGSVDGLDYLVWADHFAASASTVSAGTTTSGDYNGDGAIDGLDYLLFVDQFGTQPLSPAEAARVDFHGADLSGKDGPLASVGVGLAQLYHEYRAYSAVASPQGEFVPSDALMQVVKGQIVVDVVADTSPSAGPWQSSGSVDDAVAHLVTQLEGYGATITGSYGRMVSALLPISAIPAVASIAGMQSMTASAMASSVGLVDSQGDVAMRSDLARLANDVDGTGITVGVLSDSYNALGGAATDVINGDLPPNVTVLADAGGSDEGRAMMQLVADVAPGADLAFHTAFLGQASFAQGIVDLANVAGADVIVDDVIYFAEPMFQDGVIAQAIDSVVASGVAYFSSAGNNARDSYESPFQTSGNNLVLDSMNLGQLHDFDPGAGVDNFQAITLNPGGGFFMSFQWDDSFASVSGVGAETDLDLFVFGTDTPTSSADLFAAGISNNLGGDPYEQVAYFNPNGVPQTVYIAISKYAGPAPDLLKYVGFFAGATIDEFDTHSGTAYGHTNAAGASSVGAAFYQQTPEFGVAPAELESFSSAGDIPILFDTAGNRLATPEMRQTPDIVGPDGANTTFFGFDVEPDGYPNFFGTSASAPHLAGVAALMLSAAGGAGSLTPAETYSVLESTARDMDDPATPGFDFGYDSGTGWGMVDAEAAVASVAVAQPPVRNFPVPLDAVAPDGSLIYAGTQASSISSPDDSDGYLISVDPGQTITVAVAGDAELQASVRLYRTTSGSGNQLVAESVAALPGGDAVIQSAATRGRLAGNGPGPETYLVEVTGVGGTAGRYSLDVVLNSALEDEAHGGTTNDTPADAQDLNPSFIPLHNAIGDGLGGLSPQPGRGAVLGTLDSVPGGIIAEVEPNQPVAGLLDVAQNIDGAGWNVNTSPDLTFSGFFPHVSITGSGDGTFDYYSFTVGAGVGANFDIDYENFDTELFLYDAEGNLLAANDDSGGDSGSGSGTASFISHVFSTAGTYVIGVGAYDSYDAGGLIGGAAPAPGDVYTLHVVLQNHALNPGGVDPLPELEPNDAGALADQLVSFAQNIDGASFSRAPDASITMATSLPHVTIQGSGDGTFDYYTFQIDAPGRRGIFDIDFENFDTELFLFDDHGNLLAENDDDASDPGSGTGVASYIDYTFAAPGSYVIGVGRFYSSAGSGLITGDAPVPGDVYTLHVSLEGHATVESPPDWYSYDLLAGQTTTLAATSLNGGDVHVELYDADGNLVAAELPAAELVENGGFETGNFSGWTTTTTAQPFRPWAVSGAGDGGGFDLDVTAPQDGNFVAWNGFDGIGPMTFTMSQDIVIPAAAPAALLQWQDRVQWNFQLGDVATEPRTYDVQVRDPATNALIETIYSFSTSTQDVNPTGDTGWLSHAVDLSAYIGSTIRLQFEEYIPQSSTGPAQIEFDAISLITNDAPPTTNVDALLRFVAPETGTYYVRVFGDSGTDYSLLASRAADFGIEDNNDIGSAQEIFANQTAGRQWLYGAINAVDPAEGIITFDELPAQPINGVSVDGVTFEFTIGGVASPLATFGSTGPGTTTFLSAPLADGPNAGILAWDFDKPVDTLSFGVALSTIAAVPVGFEVELFDAGGSSLGVFPMATEPLVSFTEGLFEYAGPAVSRVVVDFNEAVAGAFAVDNIKFTTATASSAASDFYRVEIGRGAPLDVETLTPAHQSGEFVNRLDPVLRLYDASGNLVAMDDNGAADGVNARLRYHPPRGEEGTYYIEVAAASAEVAASGDYILTVKGATLPAALGNVALGNADAGGASSGGGLAGDGNGDGRVSGADFLVWANGFVQAGAAPQADVSSSGGDYNNDGAIDGRDFLVWASGYAASATSPAPLAVSVAPLAVRFTQAHDSALEQDFAAPLPSAADAIDDLIAAVSDDRIDDATLTAWRISLAFDALDAEDADGASS
ncbi:MAG: DVUA0089 family protein [Pirellulales bacterium]